MSGFRRWVLPLAVLAGFSVVAGAASAQQKEVVIGYQDMIVPWRYAQETGELEARTGYKVTYRKIGSGAEVVRALASGAIDIGEAGSAPFAAALSQGVPLKIFWVLTNINDAEALVAREGSGVHSVADLRGHTIALPHASTTHFHTLVALEQAGVAARDVRILNLRPPEIQAAWTRGDIDATFIWDPVLQSVKQNGSVLLTSGQLAASTGKATFDALAVRNGFASKHDAFLAQFVQVLAGADADYREHRAQWTQDSAPVRAVAKWSGATPASVPASLALYAFVPPAEQATAQWLGGGKDGVVARSLAATAAFLKEQGTIGAVLPDYSTAVEPRWVEQAATAAPAPVAAAQARP